MPACSSISPCFPYSCSTLGRRILLVTVMGCFACTFVVHAAPPPFELSIPGSSSMEAFPGGYDAKDTFRSGIFFSLVIVIFTLTGWLGLIGSSTVSFTQVFSSSSHRNAPGPEGAAQAVRLANKNAQINSRFIFHLPSLFYTGLF